MLIDNTFHVDLPVGQAWEILTDLTRVAPCMPGAELDSIEDGEHHGVVKVRVGSITAQYRGTARLRETDEEAHRLVVEARGHETRGQGRASATITARLSPRQGGTDVEVSTDLQISGRVAQFGRGVLQDVSAKLMDQFVEALREEVAGTTDAPAPTTTAGDAPTDVPLPAEPAPTEPLDLLALGGGSILRRAAPVAVAVMAAVVVIVLVRGRSDR